MRVEFPFSDSPSDFEVCDVLPSSPFTIFLPIYGAVFVSLYL